MRWPLLLSIILGYPSFENFIWPFYSTAQYSKYACSGIYEFAAFTRSLVARSTMQFSLRINIFFITYNVNGRQQDSKNVCDTISQTDSLNHSPPHSSPHYPYSHTRGPLNICRKQTVPKGQQAAIKQQDGAVRGGGRRGWGWKRPCV